MANVQKLVIPKGLINPKETTIVEIPAELQSVGTVVATPKVEGPSTQKRVAKPRRGSKTFPRQNMGGKDYFDNQTYGGYVMESSTESQSMSRTQSRQTMSSPGSPGTPGGQSSSDPLAGYTPPSDYTPPSGYDPFNMQRAPTPKTPDSLNYEDIFGSPPHSINSPIRPSSGNRSYHGDLSPIPSAGEYSGFDPFYMSSAVKRDGPPSPQIMPPVDHRSMSLPKVLDSDDETYDYFQPPRKSSHKYADRYDSNQNTEMQVEDTDSTGLGILSGTVGTSGSGGAACAPCMECSGEMDDYGEQEEEGGSGDLLDSLEELEQRELSSILNDTRSFHSARRKLIFDASGLSSAEEYVSGYLSSGGGSSSGGGLELMNSS